MGQWEEGTRGGFVLFLPQKNTLILQSWELLHAERFPLPLAGFPIRRRSRFLLRSLRSRTPTRCCAMTPRSSSSSSRANWLRRQSTRYQFLLSPAAARTQGVTKVLLCRVSRGHQPLPARWLSYLHVVALPSLLSMPKHPGWGWSHVPPAFQGGEGIVLCEGFHQGSDLHKGWLVHAQWERM